MNCEGNMDYKGLEIKEEKDRVIIENIMDFEPVHIFECGQCFRWTRENDESFTGVAKGKVVNVKWDSEKLIITNSDFGDFKNIWFEYFDLGRDYSEIKRLLCLDDIMAEAIKFGHGIRILKQDLWETLISFIISANNRIPRIMKTVNVLSCEFGREIDFNGRSYYSFPEIEALSNSSVEHLEVCKGGFRCKYIYKTANIVRQGLVDLNLLDSCSTDEARVELTKFPGVGNKVADCTLLFSGKKQDVFPTDVWVKRVMEELYFKREASFKEIQEFAKEYFGPLTGFAQQYLFYYARENRIGTK
jgi:N-glycosylase/DNA lyase